MMEQLLERKFYGVYLLCSESVEKRFKGKCYIGFTVNPKRRIRQHNQGIDFGGARKTNNRGPWTMVLIVHGFPNNISALQFEWAWQQPSFSSRLKQYTELKRKRPKEAYLEYNVRILQRMLNVGPWERLPLIVQWLDEKYKCNNLISILTDLPTQMKINLQEEDSAIDYNNDRNALTKQEEAEPVSPSLLPNVCHLCMKHFVNSSLRTAQKRRVRCIRRSCKLICHLICLANYLISQDSESVGHYIPIKGTCPLCDLEFLWIDLLRNQQIYCQGKNNSDTDDSLDQKIESAAVSNLDALICSNDSTEYREPNGSPHIYSEDYKNDKNDPEIVVLSD